MPIKFKNLYHHLKTEYIVLAPILREKLLTLLEGKSQKEYDYQTLAELGFQEVLDEAIENGINRLELEVSEKNKFAISLYEKLGFEVEGVKRRAFLVNGNYEDELIMGKII